MKSIAIIGAGPAGLSAAYVLSKHGYSVDLFESGPAVGGMAKSFEIWGQIVDLGPHRFFSSDTRVNTLWLEAVKNDYIMVDRLTRIYYRNTFFNYPLKPLNALRGLGVSVAFLCICSFIKIKIFPIRPETTFDAWVTNRFGKILYAIFFKSYSEKLWGIPCSSLDADFASQRIKRLSLMEAIKSSFFKSNSNKHKTLVDQFVYPKKGAGAVYEQMAEIFVANGGRLHLSTRIDGVNLDSETGASNITHNGVKVKFDHIISTMPLTILVEKLNAPAKVLAAASKLKFRNTILVYLLLEDSDPFPDQWIYVHSSELLTGRITNFKNWGHTINNGSEQPIICMEYWCYDEDVIWQSPTKELVELASIELLATGLIGTTKILDGEVVRVPKCYPVYSTGYKEQLNPIIDYLSKIKSITPIGRYGSFKYNNQDHSILMGLLAADNIINDAKHNLWEINTDYEYQESSRITETGLMLVKND